MRIKGIVQKFGPGDQLVLGTKVVGEGPMLRKRTAQQIANADLLTVGAVYDRAVFTVEWTNSVIDRAWQSGQRTF
jgi:hypothetical protein